MSQTHPFLDTSYHIPWSRLTPEHVAADMEVALREGTEALDRIIAVEDGKETLENTFLALEDAQDLVGRPWHLVNHLTAVSDSPEIRKAHREMLPKATEFFSSIPLNQGLYLKLKQFAASPACRELDPVRRRFVSETLKDFEDAGAALDEKTRQRLKDIESLLADKTKTYADNCLDSLNAFEKVVDSKEELAGLPESAVEAALSSAKAKGYGTGEEPKYRFTLHMPSYLPVLQHADSDALRKELFLGFKRVGHFGKYENGDLVREILTLRKEKADLLGRKNFPDWVLSRRMAKSGRKAMEFVEDLHDRTGEAFAREHRELQEFKAAKTGQPAGPLTPWEVGYWSEKLRKEKFDFDEEALRPYFPVESVMRGMFELVETVFGIKVKEQTEDKPETWHPEVQYYNILDAASGRHLGSFYTDWYPRDSKQSGAWMNYLITGREQEDGTLSPHLGLMIGNLTPPVGDKPALLSHRDVETIFHEFGHLLHHLLSEVRVRSLCGVNVAWDFVELPSQIMENWCWERESLDLFARHYKTGEKIPDDLYRKLVRTRTFGAARLQMRQLSFGRMDLSLHLEFDPASGEDLDAFIDQALEGYLDPVSEKFPSNVRNFGHLFTDSTGYAAGYYSYKWAEVLDADAFTRFLKEGIMNPETGRAFRKAILAKGNSEEPAVLFREFMGRDPDPQALLVRLGLV